MLAGCAVVLTSSAAFAQYNYYDAGAFAFNQNNYPPITTQKPLPTAQQYTGIAEQLRRSMSASGVWSNMSNDQRQRAFARLA